MPVSKNAGQILYGHLLPFSKFRIWIQNVRCDHHAPLQHRRGAPAIVHLQVGLGSRRRSQPLPQDCGWQKVSAVLEVHPAWISYFPSPWSSKGTTTISRRCFPAAWSTPSTSSWSLTQGTRAARQEAWRKHRMENHHLLLKPQQVSLRRAL